MARRRIVVADDHDETRAWIAALLASDFDVVATVADGQAAVEAAGALYPDLVVLDITMPRLNGFEAGALIRDLRIRPGFSLPPLTTMRQSPAPRPCWARRRWCGSGRC